MNGVDDLTIELNVPIPMSDGARLAANLFRPSSGGPFPVAMSFYPYHKDGLIGAQLQSAFQRFARAGYAALLVDLRGTGCSDGVATDSLDPLRPEDLVDAIAWSAAQPWSSGKVGVWGISYGGVTSLAAAAENPPALRAIAPIMGVADTYRHLACPGGSINMAGVMGAWLGLMHAMNLLPPIHRDAAGRWKALWGERLAGYQPHVLAGVDHPLVDPYWDRATIPLERIRVPTLVIAGWRDIFPQDCIEQFTRIDAPKQLVVGPWLHTLPGFSVVDPVDEVVLVRRWFDHWLKGEPNGVPDEPAVRVFVQGPIPGQSGGWATASSWPPPGGSRLDLFLGSDRTLGERAPTSDGSVEYTTDLSVGVEAGLASPIPMAMDYPQDQRRDDSRSACFTTAPLAEEMIVAGSPALALSVRPSGTDPTLAAKLCDVDSSGRSRLITSGWLRLTHREGHRREEPVVPGERVSLAFPLWETAYRVEAGHRLRLSLALADFPRIWPSPASGQTVSFEMGPEHPARLSVPLARAEALPPASEPLPASDLETLLGEASVLFQPAWEVATDVLKERTTVRVGLDMRIEAPGGLLCHVDHHYEAEVGHAPPGDPELRARTTIHLNTRQGQSEAFSSHRITADRIEVECSLKEDGEEILAKKWEKGWRP